MASELIIPVDTTKAWPFGSKQADQSINIDRLSVEERKRLETDAEIDFNAFTADEDPAEVFKRCRRSLAARHVLAVIRTRDRLRAGDRIQIDAPLPSAMLKKTAG